VIRVIESSVLKWAKHVVRTKDHISVIGNLKGRLGLFGVK